MQGSTVLQAFGQLRLKLKSSVSYLDRNHRSRKPLGGAFLAHSSRTVTGRHLMGCYERVKGRSHTVEKRLNRHPHKPHATSQPSRFHGSFQLRRCKATQLRKLTSPCARSDYVTFHRIHASLWAVLCVTPVLHTGRGVLL